MCTRGVFPVLVPNGLAALLQICLCSAPVHAQEEARWDGTVRDSAGVAIVENFGGALWTDETRWSLTEVWKIGTADGDPEYMFGDISTLALLSDGTVVVADRMGPNLKFFTPAGVHLRTVGRAGSGPEDFSSDIRVYRAYGDTLLVVDVKNMQVHRLAPDGTWLDSWRSFPQDGWIIHRWTSAPSGRIATLMRPFQMPDSPPAVDSLDTVLIRDVRGEVLDTLARVPTRPRNRGVGGAPESRYWAGNPDFGLTWSGGLVTGRSDSYRLKWYDENGDLERIVSLRRERQPITERDRSLVMEKKEQALSKARLPPAQIAQYKSASVHFEDYYPAWRSFICGVDGTVWVQRLTAVSALGEQEFERFEKIAFPPTSSEWDVFDREGRYLGVMDMPTGAMSFSFVGDRIYGVWKDELGIQYIAAWRIDGLQPREEG
jgi:hypothetical protein